MALLGLETTGLTPWQRHFPSVDRGRHGQLPVSACNGDLLKAHISTFLSCYGDAIENAGGPVNIVFRLQLEYGLLGCL